MNQATRPWITRWLAVAAVVAGSHSLTAALIARYSLDDSNVSGPPATVVDSVSGINGTRTAGTADTVVKVEGSAAAFFGNSDATVEAIDLGNSFNFVPGVDSWTVTAWVRNTDNKDGTIFSRADGAIGVRQFQLFTTDAANRYLAVNVGGVLQQSTARLTASDRFYHVAAVVTPTGVTLYLDSAATNILNAAIGAATQATTAKIGARNPGEGFPFEGWLDDIQVYNGALSAADVAYLKANPGVSIPEPASALLAALGGLTLLRRGRKTCKAK